jgi:D-alanyl-D-alanine carboxypeptidase
MSPLTRFIPHLLYSLAFVWLLTLPDSALSTETAAPATITVPGQQPDADNKAIQEMVVIDTVKYPVPAPWAGNKLTPPADTIAHLQQIPKELTLNQTEIYLRNEAIEPLKALAALARKDNVALLVDSAYRSARYQRTIFRQFLERGLSFDNIARKVAPPGYSEHMLGTVVDFHPSNGAFAQSAAYRWLRRHAAEYGFSETYSRHNHKNQPWEPWHWKFALPAEKVPTDNQNVSFNISPKKRAAIREVPFPAHAPSFPPDGSIKPKLSLQIDTDHH